VRERERLYADRYGSIAKEYTYEKGIMWMPVGSI
jgi:hypothetical protein